MTCVTFKFMYSNMKNSSHSMPFQLSGRSPDSLGLCCPLAGSAMVNSWLMVNTSCTTIGSHPIPPYWSLYPIPSSGEWLVLDWMGNPLRMDGQY